MFDAHFHIIDPNYPLIANNDYLPDPFIINDYLSLAKQYGFQGGAVVSGSFQGFDQSYLITALQKLGDGYVGVTNLSVETTDEEIVALAKQRIRAVRFNLYRGGSEDVAHIKELAHRIHDLASMHIELYVDSSAISELLALLISLPKVSIDHLGLKQAGLKNLFYLVEHGVHVKATGFMRNNFKDLADVLRQIYNINPNALMFGSDLPGTRASRLFNGDDIVIIKNNFDKQEQANIFGENAEKFYRSGNSDDLSI